MFNYQVTQNRILYTTDQKKNTVYRFNRIQFFIYIIQKCVHVLRLTPENKASLRYWKH